MAKNDGGPAFPTLDEFMKPVFAGTHEVKVEYVAKGMSLRDYFAGQALDGMLSSCDPGYLIDPELYAKRSYQLADAMLAEREKSNG